MTNCARAELVAQWVDAAKVLAELQIEKAAFEGDQKADLMQGPISRDADRRRRQDRLAVAHPALASLLDPAAVPLVLAAFRRERSVGADRYC
jgi:hypothetical protein